MSIILFFLYPIAVQVERGGWWLLLAPITLLTLAIDVLANYTELSLILWEMPKRREYTFSTRLLRLKYDRTWRGYYCAFVIMYLNYWSPSGKHV